MTVQLFRVYVKTAKKTAPLLAALSQKESPLMPGNSIAHGTTSLSSYPMDCRTMLSLLGFYPASPLEHF